MIYDPVSVQFQKIGLYLDDGVCHYNEMNNHFYHSSLHHFQVQIEHHYLLKQISLLSFFALTPATILSNIVYMMIVSQVKHNRKLQIDKIYFLLFQHIYIFISITTYFYILS